MRDATLPLHSHDERVVAFARPHRKFGDYAVVAPLARGGMGGVYLAVHRGTNERVALKVLDPQFANHEEVVRRLFAEHAIASRVRHRNVVEIRAANRGADGAPYLVMEYLDGETLGAISERGPLPLASIVAIAAEVASAGAALHAQGIIHCDFKPDNMFVLRDGHVKLIDFGVSRFIDEPPADDTIAGTPWCMAPEQWDGAPTLASDVYALGCTLYELCTGAPPFGGSLPELMLAHLEQRPARPSWLRAMPIELERLILRSLAKPVDARPTMRELAYELTALVASGSSGTVSTYETCRASFAS